MLDVHFVILGAVCSAVGQYAYVRDTLRGKTQPNRVTFLLWAAAPMLAFAVELDAGVGLRSLMTFMAGAGPVAVLVASFASPHAAWRISRLDLVCGALSIAGTVGWLVTRDGLIAIVSALGADFLAGLPTVRKSWQRPDTETAAAYAGGALNAGITLLTITRITAVEVAFPAYIFCFASLQVLLVGGRLGPRLAKRRRRLALSDTPRG